jgi:hypothetical protein
MSTRNFENQVAILRAITRYHTKASIDHFLFLDRTPKLANKSDCPCCCFSVKARIKSRSTSAAARSCARQARTNASRSSFSTLMRIPESLSTIMTRYHMDTRLCIHSGVWPWAPTWSRKRHTGRGGARLPSCSDQRESPSTLPHGWLPERVHVPAAGSLLAVLVVPARNVQWPAQRPLAPIAQGGAGIAATGWRQKAGLPGCLSSRGFELPPKFRLPRVT